MTISKTFGESPSQLHRALAPSGEYFVVFCGWLLLEKSHCSSGFQKRRPAALKTQMTPTEGLMPAGARMAGAAALICGAPALMLFFKRHHKPTKSFHSR